MFGLFGLGTKNYEELRGAEFKAKYNATPGAVLIDVRTQGEFRSGSIRGARNIDIMSANFAQQISTLDKSKEYFLFCRSGNRSGQACNMMAKQGFKVHNLAGGVSDWPA
ncbi:MAG: rhodanese-like domain-containing protein [Cyclobacteriaceae bacterium]|nr:rhodanese-like domain-containing protein [Cyclobacteriaceae bacterium]